MRNLLNIPVAKMLSRQDQKLISGGDKCYQPAFPGSMYMVPSSAIGCTYPGKDACLTGFLVDDPGDPGAGCAGNQRCVSTPEGNRCIS